MLALTLLALPPLRLHKVWGYEFTWPNGISSPGAVYPVGDRLFFTEPGGSDGGPYGCLDARTGRVVWRQNDAGTMTVSPGVEGGHVVVRVGGEVREVDPADGRTLWAAQAEPLRLGPFVVGDRLVVETAKGRLEGFDLRTHRAAWRLDYPAEFAGDDRNAMAGIADGSLWAVAGDGKAVAVDLATGRLRFARPFDGGDAGRIVAMRGAVAICGTKGTATWRTADGATLWRRPDLIAANGFYAAARDELWQVTNDWGSLTRVRASDGRRAGPAVSLGKGFGFVDAPTPFDGGYALPDHEGVLRLNAEGRPTGHFPTLYTPLGLLGVGRDLVAWQGGAIVRLAPGVGVVSPDAAARAAALAAKPALDDHDQRALWDLGRAAVPALMAAAPDARERRQEGLLFALTHLADARDTGAMLGLAERIGTFTAKSEGFWSDVGFWLRTKGDGDTVARTLLPRLRAAKDDAEARRWIGFMDRSADAAVVDELFARLRSPASSAATKSLVYNSIAASGRPDALDWILRDRASGRRLATPIPGLSTTKDTDGDGIPDAFDANPTVAPRRLTERERVMAAAFDAFARFGGRDEPLIDVGYGPGVRPFELTGWKGGLRPLKDDFDRKPGSPPWGLSFETFSSDGDVVRFEPGGREATVRIDRRYGYGTEERLRKIRGEWFVVFLRGTWVN